MESVGKSGRLAEKTIILTIIIFIIYLAEEKEKDRQEVDGRKSRKRETAVLCQSEYVSLYKGKLI